MEEKKKLSNASYCGKQLDGNHKTSCFMTGSGEDHGTDGRSQPWETNALETLLVPSGNS